MCARFVRRVDIHVCAKVFDFVVETPTPPGYNIAATDLVDAVLFDVGGRKHVPMPWGFLPAWAKDTKTRYVNARAETVGESKMFRSSFEKRRCLVLADGIIEWRTVEKRKLPYLFTLKDDGPFAFAGIWNRTRIGETSLESCAILTTGPNELFARVHDRMPVVLRPEAVAPWLDPGADLAALKQWLGPYPAEQMSVRPISTKINNSRHKTPDCLESASPAAMDDLFASIS